MNRHPATADRAAVASADDLQPDYFLRMLTQICRRTNLRLDMYRRAITVAEADGDVGYACAFRHLTHIEEHDRQILEGMIDHLQQRFSSREADEYAPISRRARSVVR